MKRHVLIDEMDDGGPNVLRCSCGVRLWSDCDISLVSIVQCFEEHLLLVGGET